MSTKYFTQSYIFNQVISVEKFLHPMSERYFTGWSHRIFYPDSYLPPLLAHVLVSTQT